MHISPTSYSIINTKPIGSYNKNYNAKYKNIVFNGKINKNFLIDMSLVWGVIISILSLPTYCLYACSRGQALEKERKYEQRYDSTLNALAVGQNLYDFNNAATRNDIDFLRDNTVKIFDSESYERKFMENKLIDHLKNSAKLTKQKGSETDFEEYYIMWNEMFRKRDEFFRGN